MDDFVPPPPPPPSVPAPPPPPRMNKDGHAITLAEQLGITSSALQASSGSHWLSDADDATYGNKSETGFVGLGNQGATCYMNSAIQTLFMTPEFRSAIYKWRYNPEVDGPKEDSIPYQLQKLFARLQLGNRKFVETKELTKSFGWTDNDAFQQHDIQELFLVLFDALETSYQHTRFHGADTNQLVRHLFVGEFSDYIECLECKNKRIRRDSFFDVQLGVKGLGSLDEALKAFIQPEILNEGNQYNCENCQKKVDAKKGLQITAVPDLLILQLKRFDFDWSTLTRIKLNHRVEFPFNLNMTPYVNVDTTCLDYELYSVLIAAGGALGGHYYAYIKDLMSDEQDKWYHFNDSSVTVLSDPLKEISKMYGTNPEPQLPKIQLEDEPQVEVQVEVPDENVPKPPPPPPRSGLGTNAYMLVYRKITSRDNLSLLGNKDQIPQEIQDEIQVENAEFVEARKKYEFEREHVRLRIWYKGKPDFVRLHKSETIRAATKKAVEQIMKENAVPLEQARLRDFNVLSKIPGKSYSDLDETIENLKLDGQQHFLLETRLQDEEFPREDSMILPIIRVKDTDDDSYEEEAPIEISVPRAACSLGDLRNRLMHLEELVDILPDKMRIFRIDKDNHKAILLEGDDKDLVADLNVVPGTPLHVEECRDLSKSKTLHQMTVTPYLIDIGYNKLKTSEDAVASFSEDLVFDTRKTLRELKEKIASELGIQVETFRLCKNAQGHQFKDLNSTLEESGFYDGICVMVELGAQMTKDEAKIHFKRYDINNSEPWSPLCEHEIDGSKPADVILKELRSIVPDDIKFFRLRDKLGIRPGKVLSGSQPLNKMVLKFEDGKELVIQPLDFEAENFQVESSQDSQILIEIARWDPSNLRLERKHEIFIGKDWTIGRLRVTLSEFSGALGNPIQVENLRIAKPRTYQLKEPATLMTLPWEIDDTCQVTGTPLQVSEGELLIYKDSSIAESMDVDGISTSTSTSRSVYEPSIVIHTRWDRKNTNSEETQDSQT